MQYFPHQSAPLRLQVCWAKPQNRHRWIQSLYLSGEKSLKHIVRVETKQELLNFRPLFSTWLIPFQSQPLFTEINAFLNPVCPVLSVFHHITTTTQLMLNWLFTILNQVFWQKFSKPIDVPLRLCAAARAMQKEKCSSLELTLKKIIGKQEKRKSSASEISAQSQLNFRFLLLAYDAWHLLLFLHVNTHTKGLQ